MILGRSWVNVGILTSPLSLSPEKEIHTLKIDLKIPKRGIKSAQDCSVGSIKRIPNLDP